MEGMVLQYVFLDNYYVKAPPTNKTILNIKRSFVPHEKEEEETQENRTFELKQNFAHNDSI